MEYVLKKGQSYIGGEDGNYQIICNPALRTVFASKPGAELCMKKVKQQGIKMKGWDIICIGTGNVNIEDIIQTDTYVLTNGKSFVGRNSCGSVSLSAPLHMVSVYHSFGKAKKALEALHGLCPGLKGYEIKTFEKALKEIGDMASKNIPVGNDGHRKGNTDTFWARNDELYHDGKMHILAERKVCNDVDKMIDAFEENIKSKDREYRKDLDDIGKFMVDIYHLFEFSEFKEGDERIYKLYALFQQTLRKRRDLKDSIEKIQKTRNVRKEMKNITESFKKMQGRTYVPRAVEEVFADMQTKGFVINPSRQYVENKKKPESRQRTAVRIPSMKKHRNKNVRKTGRGKLLGRTVKAGNGIKIKSVW